MIEKKMDQRSKTEKVVGTEIWEKYMWPHQIDKTAAAVPVEEQKTKLPATVVNKTNTVGPYSTQLFNNFDGAMSGVTINYK